MGKIRPSGGYRKLATFQMATIIYDATVWFCERYLAGKGRMTDQLVQAARSGRQNIAEGSRASATSSQTERRLVNVARSSLEELLLDYEDYLRHRRLPQWDPNGPEASAVRRIPREFGRKSDRTDRTDSTDRGQERNSQNRSNPSYRSDRSFNTGFNQLTDQQRWQLYSPWLDHDDPAIRANALICLIHQANYLLDQQIAALEKQFIEGGGYSEQLAAARLVERGRRKSSPSDRSDPTDPTDPTDQIPECPQCGNAMALRTARQGRNVGQSFWGCTGYPDCRGILPV